MAKGVSYPLVRRSITGLFALSGVSGLVYETLWTRKLVLAFGSTAFGVSASLACYLTGLAVGAYLFGRFAEKHHRPVQLYALMELAIAGLGAVSLHGLDLANRAFLVLRDGFSLPSQALPAIQFLTVLLALAPATVLMGGTLPVLVAALPEDCRLGSRVGRLYGANTAGAVAGCAIAGFVLLPLSGMLASALAAAGLNLAVGLAALAILARTDSTERPRPDQYAMPVTGDSPDRSNLRPAVATAVVLVSGFCIFLYEVIWTRSLELVLGNSTQAFSLMLVTVLAGLAAGTGFIGWVIHRFKPAAAWLAAVQIMTGASVVAATALIPRTPGWFLALYPTLGGSRGALLLGQLAICAAILLAPCIVMGMSFPLVADLALGGRRREAERTGRLYALSTIGCIAGASLGGMVMIPLLGLSRSLIVGACLNLGLAALLAFEIPGRIVRRWVTAAALGTAAAAVFAMPQWDKKVMTSGVFQHAPEITKIGFERYQAQSELLYYREGRTATVAVKRGETTTVLSIDGRPEGNTRAKAQTLLGHAPFMLGRMVRDVFIVGFGTGSTAGTVTLYPVRQVTVAELEPFVLEASRFFEDINHRPLRDPRVRAVIDDARNRLASGSGPAYDLIISQPSLPWVSGAAKLFTAEFYRQARSRLREDGVFAQWVQLYNLELKSLRSLMGTFTEVFPESLVLEVGGTSGEIMMLGSARRLELRWEDVREAFSRPETALDLARVGIPSPAGVLARVLLGSRETSLLAAGPRNTDDNGLLEFASLRSLFSETTEANITYLRQKAGSPWAHIGGAPQGPERQRLLIEMGLVALREASLERGLQFAREAVEIEGNVEAHRLLGDMLYANRRQEEGIAAWKLSLAQAPEDLPTLRRLIRHYKAEPDQNRPPEYRTWLRRVGNAGLDEAGEGELPGARPATGEDSSLGSL